jgi:hypothetical protein
VEAEAVEGAHRRVPFQAQPPSITERSMDLHYGFPSSFPGREEGRPWGGFGPSLGNPRRVRMLPGPGCPGSPQVPPSSVP